MNKNNVRVLESYVENFLTSTQNKNPSEAQVMDSVNIFKNLITNLSEEEINEAIKNIQYRFRIVMDTGYILSDKENYKKWYFNSIAERGTSYSDRYNVYLMNDLKLPSNVIDKMDETTSQIMDNLADPKSEIGFSRKGLVIGAVQSGKTSNYIALMNKALDSGYKVFIVLTGTLEKLRKQTQARIDEGFIGTDSDVIRKNKSNLPIGVGKYDNELNIISSYTTKEKDFDMKEVLTINNQKGAVVFVLKKNKAPLQKLKVWLKTHNTDPITGKIEQPLLIIDDEADNASINTSKPDEDPTTINKEIRELIKLFSKSSYVGFTATPFANIFINPQFEEEEKDDLFPRDFIALLEQPSNYVGPYELYKEDGAYHYMLNNNDDVERVLPLKHKKHEMMTHLPKTLKDAIRVFFLANAIRDIRGDTQKHRSMLIHISRFIDIQNDVRDQVDRYVKKLQREIKNYILLEDETPMIKDLRTVFEKEFGFKATSELKIKEKWEDIKPKLYQSVAAIQVKVVNSGTASQGLNYEEYEDGLRIIAIGGLSLARGLTLEGLMTSYFFRNTKMYDTLMQMGRWFGYRDGYADICRLWTSSESIDWYEHIAEATEELKIDIKRMIAQNQKPKDFGLRIRSTEDFPLIVTAMNKMRSTDKRSLVRSLNGQIIETPLLECSKEKLSINNAIIKDWLNENMKYYVQDNSILKNDRPTFKNVPKEAINNLLSTIKYPELNGINEAIENIINRSEPVLKNWDVVVATVKTKEKENVDFGPLKIKPIERSFDIFGVKEKHIRMNASKKRLGSIEYSSSGLTKEEYSKIEPLIEEQRKSLKRTKTGKLRAASGYMYFNSGIKRNPQIVIYPVKLKNNPRNNISLEKYGYLFDDDLLATGISIGIPTIDGQDHLRYTYQINVVMQRELLGIPLFSDEPEDEDDEELAE